MLKIRPRRTWGRGGGIYAKPGLKSKCFKKTLLSSYVHDRTLITSTSRKLNAAALSRKVPLANARFEPVTGSKRPPAAHCSVRPEPSHSKEVAKQGSGTSSLDDETIFSPGFHQVKGTTNECNEDGGVEVTSGLTIHCDNLGGPAIGPEEKNNVLIPLLRCSSSVGVDPPQQSPEPEAACLEDNSDVDPSNVDDSVLSDSDPYIFIKRLPKISDVVPLYRPFLLPKQTRRSHAKTLVLDLDETLVHSTMDICAEADVSFPVDFNHHQHTIHVRLRPHLNEFLDRVSNLFEVVVFTASQGLYADKLLNILDPLRQRIHHRVFRDSCVFVNGNYLKDLTILGRDLAKVAIVDNSPQAFGFQVDNGIPIESWFEDKEDSALIDLLPFLESLVDLDDVRPAIATRFNLMAEIESVTLPKNMQL